MTKIKLCGLSRTCDIEAANGLMPEYVGFVFVPQSKRYVSPEKASVLKRSLADGIQAVGVFADEAPETVAALLNNKVIDVAQLHGSEDEAYIARLRGLTDAPVIQVFRVGDVQDILVANASSADYVLLDSGAGTGKRFDWQLIGQIGRPFFLAGGLDAENVSEAIHKCSPFAVDVSSGIETNGFKDQAKMAAFVAAVRTVRKEENK
ncbi:MAG: phosphoribosylanthranilate isomerase [Clostridia bacterium]|nr:phosphoribosylanthranilate isomerase [Clostridia bacterium]